jgi:hypothetical protein
MAAFLIAIALAILSAVAVSVVALVVNASALSASRLLIRGLMRLFWLEVDAQTRAERFADLDARLHDEIADLQEQGYPPSQIAVHLLLASNLAWAWG